MKEKNILIISILISILGIILLLLISLTFQPKQIKIKQINSEMLNQKVKVSGKVISLKNYDNFQLITLNDSSGKITIINNNPINLTKNQNIIVQGKVEEYKNQLEINAIKINVLSLKTN